MSLKKKYFVNKLFKVNTVKYKKYSHSNNNNNNNTSTQFKKKKTLVSSWQTYHHVKY